MMLPRTLDKFPDECVDFLAVINECPLSIIPSPDYIWSLLLNVQPMKPLFYVINVDSETEKKKLPEVIVLNSGTYYRSFSTTPYDNIPYVQYRSSDNAHEFTCMLFKRDPIITDYPTLSIEVQGGKQLEATEEVAAMLNLNRIVYPARKLFKDSNDTDDRILVGIIDQLTAIVAVHNRTATTRTGTLIPHIQLCPVKYKHIETTGFPRLEFRSYGTREYATLDRLLYASPEHQRTYEIPITYTTNAAHSGSFSLEDLVTANMSIDRMVVERYSGNPPRTWASLVDGSVDPELVSDRPLTYTPDTYLYTTF